MDDDDDASFPFISASSQPKAFRCRFLCNAYVTPSTPISNPFARTFPVHFSGNAQQAAQISIHSRFIKGSFHRMFARQDIKVLKPPTGQRDEISFNSFSRELGTKEFPAPSGPLSPHFLPAILFRPRKRKTMFTSIQ